MKRTGFGKGWRLIIYALLCYYITGTISGTMNVAIGSYHDAFGWSRVALSSLVSVASICNMITGFLAGRLCVKYSAKVIGAIFGFVYIISVLVMGYSSNFAVFGAALLVGYSISSAWGYNTTPVIIAKWFPRRKGVIMGIVTLGVPLGCVNPMVYNACVKKFGISGGFMPFVLLAIVALLVLFFFVTDDPAKIGFAPDNMQDEMSSEEVAMSDMVHVEKKAMLKILKQPVTWIVALLLGIQLFYCGGVIIQIVPRLCEQGFTVDQAVVMMMIASAGACVGSFLCGVIDDCFGVSKAILLTYIVGAVALALNLIGNPITIIAGLVLFGVVMGGAANWPASFCVEYWGEKEFAERFGILQPLIQLFGAAGPAVFAVIASVFGGYSKAYTGGILLMLAGFVGFLGLLKTNLLKKE